MKRIKNQIAFMSCVLCLAALSLPKDAFAQDLHFSQFMNSPLLTNPANTGFIPDGDFRLGANYRNQWASVTAFPYKTMSVFGDVQTMENSDNTGWMGLGGVILRDVAGTGTLTSTKIYGSIAYHQMVNAGSLVSLGFNVGWANKNINTSNLSFPSQWNGRFFDVHNVTVAPQLGANNINYLDIQVGANYAYFPTERVYLNAGFSAMHVNRPRETFFDEQQGVDNRVPVRYTGFLNGSFMVNDRVIVNPNIYASLQAKSYEIVGGLNAHYNLSGDGEKVLIAGAYYRYKDAIIPMVGLGLKDYTLTFTYDVTQSGLKTFNNGRGAIEFSIIKQGVADKYNGNRRESMCPSFKTY
ncbi:MAG: PorP/SprF family type IX secretion system membrane protein [Chitinophagaceae bacterium]|jgi:type IX secretion system PorP/SprF family membrane protein|nr:PorP/SprF family type IX secretion system membrane protein [Chitinophagaceae bacterium]MBK6383260.1 PorP/SprF family type IX secretion system membrane protein [Chitinophagaceae bacterium]MBK7678796.1 PorP/SprF family type IX secretion system membrane protein [Chitinophagaceae bacterium]MBK8299858.1 PorP/SprF family type IX secretion system membrane protein [Chitinophagaceae bacterium]MBK9463910.1 PorP/SprF family type IX secretion system membrane protein [Chitinophagaceae bacterium]